MKPKFLLPFFILLSAFAAAACGSTQPQPGPGPSNVGNGQNPPPPPPTAVQEPALSLDIANSEVVDPFEGLNFKNGWARIPFNSTVFGGYGTDQMNDVTAGGPGVLAVGFGIRNGDMNAAIWSSADGIRWVRVEGSPDLAGSGSQSLNSVAAGTDGIVAVGSETIGSDMDAAVWFSVDGAAWSRIPKSADVFGDENDQIMNQVIAFGDGYVAVGMERTPTEIRGAVWTSANGITWQRSPHAEESFGGAERFVSFETVFPVGDSLLAAGRVQAPDSEDVDTAIWSSHDGGQTWTPINNSASVLGDPGATRYQLVSGIAQSTSGLFMVGTEQNITGSSADEYINGIIWRSPDGVNWERSYEHKPDFHQQTMLDIARSDVGFVIVGYDVSGDQSQAAVWLSVDGLNWEQVPHFESVFGGSGIQRMSAVAQAGPGMVAVGSTTENGEQDAAVWIYVPER